MTSITRTSLTKCRTKGCPFPLPHFPWCREIDGVSHWPAVTHQHHPKKGMGGNNPRSKIVALLCWPCHDRIDNGLWSNGIFERDGRRYYVILDLGRGVLLERDIGTDAEAAQRQGSL